MNAALYGDYTSQNITHFSYGSAGDQVTSVQLDGWVYLDMFKRGGQRGAVSRGQRLRVAASRDGPCPRALMLLYGDDGLGGAYGVGSAGKAIMGTAAADTLVGGGGPDRFFGSSGVDVFDGGGAIDDMRGRIRCFSLALRPASKNTKSPEPPLSDTVPIRFNGARARLWSRACQVSAGAGRSAGFNKETA